MSEVDRVVAAGIPLSENPEEARAQLLDRQFERFAKAHIKNCDGCRVCENWEDRQ